MLMRLEPFREFDRMTERAQGEFGRHLFLGQSLDRERISAGLFLSGQRLLHSPCP